MENWTNWKEIIGYDPSTGLFTRNGAAVPREAVRIFVCGKQHLASRLAWRYVHGVWPGRLKHANGDHFDNRIANLRPFGAAAVEAAKPLVGYFNGDPIDLGTPEHRSETIEFFRQMTGLK